MPTRCPRRTLICGTRPSTETAPAFASPPVYFFGLTSLPQNACGHMAMPGRSIGEGPRHPTVGRSCHAPRHRAGTLAGRTGARIAGTDTRGSARGTVCFAHGCSGGTRQWIAAERDSAFSAPGIDLPGVHDPRCARPGAADGHRGGMYTGDRAAAAHADRSLSVQRHSVVHAAGCDGVCGHAGRQPAFARAVRGHGDGADRADLRPQLCRA